MGVHAEQGTSAIFFKSILHIHLFRNSYISLNVIKWNNLYKKIRNSERFSIFNKVTLKFMQPSLNSIVSCYNPKEIKLLKRLRLGLSNVHDHRLKQTFQDSLSSICNCRTNHCVKSVPIRCFFWTTFPAFGLNTERCGVSPRNQSECGKIRTRKKSAFGHFSRSWYWDSCSLLLSLSSFLQWKIDSHKQRLEHRQKDF